MRMLFTNMSLSQPLSPAEFFRNMHLTMLLRDKIGKYAVISLRESFGANEPDELAGAQLTKENISVPFYELFKLNMQSVDNELEQALTEVAPSRQAAARPAQATAGHSIRRNYFALPAQFREPPLCGASAER